MSIKQIYVIALILSVGLFFFYPRLIHSFSESSIKNSWRFTIAIALAMVSISIPLPYVVSSVGEWPAYAHFRAIPGTELLIVFIVPLASTVAQYWGKAQEPLVKGFIRSLCLIGVLAYVSIPFIKPILHPIAQGIHDERKDGIVMQTTPSTCGPASLSTIFSAHQDYVTEAEIARRAYSSGSGTENWYLARYAKSRGYEYHFLRVKDLSEVPAPAIIGVKIDRYGHFISLLSASNGKYQIADSLHGVSLMDQKEFEKHYVFTGFVLQIKK